MRFWKRRQVTLPPTDENWHAAEPGTMILSDGSLLPPSPARRARDADERRRR